MNKKEKENKFKEKYYEFENLPKYPNLYLLNILLAFIPIVPLWSFPTAFMDNFIRKEQKGYRSKLIFCYIMMTIFPFAIFMSIIGLLWGTWYLIRKNSYGKYQKLYVSRTVRGYIYMGIPSFTILLIILLSSL